MIPSTPHSGQFDPLGVPPLVAESNSETSMCPSSFLCGHRGQEGRGRRQAEGRARVQAGLPEGGSQGLRRLWCAGFAEASEGECRPLGADAFLIQVLIIKVVFSPPSSQAPSSSVWCGMTAPASAPPSIPRSCICLRPAAGRRAVCAEAREPSQSSLR